LRAPRLDPASCFAGGQESIEEPLAHTVGEQALPKIVQQREVKPRIALLAAQGILPIYTAADRIRRLAIGEPFDILHHHNQC
jgi:hypothetical protein